MTDRTDAELAVLGGDILTAILPWARLPQETLAVNPDETTLADHIIDAVESRGELGQLVRMMASLAATLAVVIEQGSGPPAEELVLIFVRSAPQA